MADTEAVFKNLTIPFKFPVVKGENCVSDNPTLLLASCANVGKLLYSFKPQRLL